MPPWAVRDLLRLRSGNAVRPQEVPAVAGDIAEDDSAVGLGSGFGEELDPGGAGKKNPRLCACGRTTPTRLPIR